MALGTDGQNNSSLAILDTLARQGDDNEGDDQPILSDQEVSVQDSAKQLRKYLMIAAAMLLILAIIIGVAVGTSGANKGDQEFLDTYQEEPCIPG